MRFFIVALLVAISYAQTVPAATGATGGLPTNPLQWKMYDELYDGFPDVGDMYDFGDFGDFGDLGMFLNGGNLPAGLPDISQLFQQLGPYAAYSDNGDIFDDLLDYAEDMYQYRALRGAAPAAAAATPAAMKLRRRHRRPSRLMRSHGKRRLRKPREFPFWLINSVPGQAANNVWPGIWGDGMDSEDRAQAIMMGANPASLPMPFDGIDTEDLWMFPHLFNKAKAAATGTATATDGTAAKPAFNWMSMYPWWSSLQKRHKF